MNLGDYVSIQWAEGDPLPNRPRAKFPCSFRARGEIVRIFFAGDYVPVADIAYLNGPKMKNPVEMGWIVIEKPTKRHVWIPRPLWDLLRVVPKATDDTMDPVEARRIFGLKDGCKIYPGLRMTKLKERAASLPKGPEALAALLKEAREYSKQYYERKKRHVR